MTHNEERAPRRSETTPTTDDRSRDPYGACDSKGNHSLDRQAGYEVWQTLDANGAGIDGYRGRLVATVEGSGRYGDALDIAYRYRGGRSYAVVEHVYACGHSSGDYHGRRLGRD